MQETIYLITALHLITELIKKINKNFFLFFLKRRFCCDFTVVCMCRQECDISEQQRIVEHGHSCYDAPV